MPGRTAPQRKELLRMASVMVLALLVGVTSLCRASNIDVISRMDRSMMPYSGSARNPFRRYRYPIYNSKRFDVVDDAGERRDGGEIDPGKRFTSGTGLWPPPTSEKKLHDFSSRYEYAMTPYDLKAMEKLHQNGRRRRTPDLYDLKQVYKIYEAGRKRGLTSDDDDDDERRKRTGDVPHDVWNLAHLADVGKRSPVTSYYDLLDMARLAKAGKRSGPDSYSLWHLAQMEAAGKKRGDVTDYDLLSLARIADAGKRDSSRLVSPYETVHLGVNDDVEGNGTDDDDTEQLVVKKKRSLDDFFGWDRKKKSVGEGAMLNDYLTTMRKEVMGESDKGSPADSDGVVGEEHKHGNEED